MSLDFSVDADIFLDDFGEACLFGGLSFKAIRTTDEELFKAGLGELVFKGSAPVLRCKTSDVSTLRENSAVSFGGVDYIVSEILPDGDDTVFSLLVLGYVYL